MRLGKTNIYLLCAINLLVTAPGFPCQLLAMERKRKWAVYRTPQSGNLAVSRDTFVEGESPS